MRRLFTAEQARADGLTRAALRWGEHEGRWIRVGRDVYAEGAEPATELDRALAPVVRVDGVARAHAAGALLGLDSVDVRKQPRKRTEASGIIEVCGIKCADGRQTLIDLASTLDDDTWEQALESALRKRLVTLAELEGAYSRRIRRVLARRPSGAAPTESLLETLMVQLARQVPGLPPPTRQQWVGRYRLDLSWPDIGLFVELDGEHHKDQPVYDARRETAVVASTRWLCGRFTWTEVNRVPRTTARRLGELADAARRRPLLP